MSKKKLAVKKGSVQEDKLTKIIRDINIYNATADKAEKLVVKTDKEAWIDKEELRHFTRVWMMDMVTMALGRMGFREKRFQNFNDILSEVVRDYDREFAEDMKDDKELIYARTLFERELKQYAGKFYRSEAVRYGLDEEVIKGG